MIVLGVILAVLAAALFLPVGMEVSYYGAGPQVKVLAGPVKILVYPRKKKKHPKKKDKQPPPVEAAEEGPKEKPGFTLHDILAFLQLFTELTGKLRQKLVISVLRLHVTFGGRDAAAVALNYGKAWAAIGAVTPVLENNFRIKTRDIQAFCDYTEEKMHMQLLFRVRVRVGQMLALGIWAGIRFMKIMIEKKRRCSNESSSS